MKKCLWEEIDGFQSLGEFNGFVAWINEQVATGKAKELLVKSPYMDATTFEEKWFAHLESGQVWRLVWPDGPFTGLFEPVA